MKFSFFGFPFRRGSRSRNVVSTSASTPNFTIKPDVELVDFQEATANNAEQNSIKNESKYKSNPVLSTFNFPETPGECEATTPNFSEIENSGPVYNSLSEEFDSNTACAMPRFPERLSEASPLRGEASVTDGEDDLFPTLTSQSRRRIKRWTVFLGVVALSLMVMLGIASIAIEFISSQTVQNGTEPNSHNGSANNNESNVPDAEHPPFLLSGNTEDIDEYEDTDVSPELVEDINPTPPERTRPPVKYPIPDVKTRTEREFRMEILTEFAHDDGPKASPLIKPSIDPMPIIIPIPVLKMANKSTLEDGLRGGKEALELRQRTETRIHQLGFSVGRGVPEAYSQYQSHPDHDSNESRSREAETLQMSLIGFSMDRAARIIAKRLNLTKEEAQQGIPLATEGQIDLKPNQWCAQKLEHQPVCVLTGIYRSADGSCNNLNHPSWGATFQPYRRILLPDYADGISRPRVAADGTLLPNARRISETLFKNKHQDDPNVSMMFPLWAEFVEHDMDYTVQSAGEPGEPIPCCENGTLLEIQHPECFPIYTSEDDPMDNQVNRHCMTVLRSAAAPSCSFGPREQFSKTTPFLDASTIYGSSIAEISTLRETGNNNSGLLIQSQTADGHFVLKALISRMDLCNIEEEVAQKHFCFESGDDRVNQNLGLTSMHLIWTRQHNTIARAFAVVNPHWDDERLFQESRRLVIAQIQHITFKEYLPLLLGPELMERAHLKLQDYGYYERYQKLIDPGISNAFSAAASHFRYSMIQGLTQFVESNSKNTDFIQTHKLFFNPFPLWTPGNLESLLRGYATAAAAKADTSFSDQVTDHMFQVRNGSFGYDLAAMHIQQGRDHGLPGYASWRTICGLDPINNFTDLKSIWNISLDAIVGIYKSVTDIDLLVGGLAETPVAGGIVGPTLACLLADQFARIRMSDRFWYEGNIQLIPFTLDQLDEIRKTTLAKILCENTDSLGSVQKNVLQQISSKNPILLCTDLAYLKFKFNYSAWAEPKPILESMMDGIHTNTEMRSKPLVDAEILEEFAEASVKSNYTAGEHHFELLENVLDKHSNLNTTEKPSSNDSSYSTTALPAILNELSLDRNNISADDSSTHGSVKESPLSLESVNSTQSNVRSGSVIIA